MKHDEVFPVRNNETFKAPVFFECLGKQLVIGMAWYAIHYTRIDHKRERTSLHSGFKSWQVEFLHVFFWDESRRAVAAREAGAIANKVL